MRKNSVIDYLPFAAAGVLIVVFVGLGIWQAGRGLEKRALQADYATQTAFSAWFDGVEVQPFARIRVRGEFDSDHQILLENIIVNSHIGYYVITPLITAADEPVLLVNRGWLENTGRGFDTASIAFSAPQVTVRGRAGSLPRVGLRMGEPFTPGSSWPRLAVYPTIEDVELALGRPVQPFVLLMDPEDPYGYYREWAPNEIGPGRHFGYALQWFAMAVAVAVLLVWNHRNRGSA